MIKFVSTPPCGGISSGGALATPASRSFSSSANVSLNELELFRCGVVQVRFQVIHVLCLTSYAGTGTIPSRVWIIYGAVVDPPADAPAVRRLEGIVKKRPARDWLSGVLPFDH
jgi:hypothetical protein